MSFFLRGKKTRKKKKKKKKTHDERRRQQEPDDPVKDVGHEERARHEDQQQDQVRPRVLPELVQVAPALEPQHERDPAERVEREGDEGVPAEEPGRRGGGAGAEGGEQGGEGGGVGQEEQRGRGGCGGGGGGGGGGRGRRGCCCCCCCSGRFQLVRRGLLERRRRRGRPDLDLELLVDEPEVDPEGGHEEEVPAPADAAPEAGAAQARRLRRGRRMASRRAFTAPSRPAAAAPAVCDRRSLPGAGPGGQGQELPHHQSLDAQDHQRQWDVAQVHDGGEGADQDDGRACADGEGLHPRV